MASGCVGSIEGAIVSEMRSVLAFTLAGTANSAKVIR